MCRSSDLLINFIKLMASIPKRVSDWILFNLILDFFKFSVTVVIWIFCNRNWYICNTAQRKKSLINFSNRLQWQSSLMSKLRQYTEAYIVNEALHAALKNIDKLFVMFICCNVVVIKVIYCLYSHLLLTQKFTQTCFLHYFRFYWDKYLCIFPSILIHTCHMWMLPIYLPIFFSMYSIYSHIFWAFQFWRCYVYKK